MSAIAAIVDESHIGLSTNGGGRVAGSNTTRIHSVCQVSHTDTAYNVTLVRATNTSYEVRKVNGEISCRGAGFDIATIVPSADASDITGPFTLEGAFVGAVEDERLQGSPITLPVVDLIDIIAIERAYDTTDVRDIGHIDVDA